MNSIQKYQQFHKVSKSLHCSLYTAVDSSTSKTVLIKRLPQKGSWDSLLNNKSFVFSSKDKMFPKLLEVFKHKKYYFIVFEKTSGSALSDTETNGKIDLHRFFSIFSGICEAVSRLKKFKANAYVEPQWVFLNWNSIKIYHFEPFYQVDKSSHHEHVYMFNIEKKSTSEDINSPGYQITKESAIQKSEDMIFNLGCMAYALLMGKNPTKAQNPQEYLQKVHQLSERCQNRLMKQTGDQKLSQMIAKMVGRNPFQAPSLEQIRNYTKHQMDLIKPKTFVKPLAVQFQMQKINLTYIKNQKNKKFSRPCCDRNFEEESSDPGSAHLLMVNSKNSLPTVKHAKRRSKSLFPGVPLTSNRHRIHCFREPIIKTTQLSRPTAFMSQDHINFREL